jgi:hypothetical protein
LFYGCQKEIALEKSDNPVVVTSNYSLTIEEVKSYVEHFKSKQNNTNSLGSTGGIFEFPLDFNWKNFVNETSFRGKNYAIVPIEDGGFFSANKGKVDVLGSFYRDSIGQITGNLFVYIADSAYSDKVKGKFNSKDFTGELMIFDLNSKFQKGVKLVDGKPQKIINDVVVSDKKNNFGNRLQTRGCLLYEIAIWTVTDCGDTFCIEYRFFELNACTWDDAGGWQATPFSASWGTGNIYGGLDPYITDPNSPITYPQNPLNPAPIPDPYIGILNDLLLIMTGDIGYSTFKARYGLYLTDAQINDLNYVVQSGNLQSTKQVEFLVNNIAYIGAFQAISGDKLSSYINLLKDNANFYQFNKSRNFPASAALALFNFRNIFSPDEFADLYLNEPLFAQVDKLSIFELSQVISQKGVKFLPYYLWEKDKIDYSQLKPCLSKLFADLNRTLFTSGIGEMGNIIKQFADGFNADAPAPAYNVTFNVVENLPVVNIDPLVVGYTSKETDQIRIFFKKDFISKASDAAIMLVYLHEMLHAFMIYQTEIKKIPNVERIHECLFEDGKPTPQDEAHHSQMANKYVEILNEAIVKWAKSQNMPQTEIDKLKDIAWNGLSKTVEYAKKKNDDPTFIDRIEKQFQKESNSLSGSTSKTTTANCY